MKKKLLSIILAAIFIISLVGCSSPKPEDVVDTFLKSTQALDIEKMAECMESDIQGDLKDITLEDSDESLKDFMDYFRKNASKMTYEIKDTKVDGDSAVVTVDCKYIDGSEALENAFTAVFDEALEKAFAGSEMSEEEIENKLVEYLNNYEAKEDKFATSTVKIDCVKKDNKWYVSDFGEDFFDVMFSNYLSIMEDMDDQLE